jgi:hypothetical protein
MRTRSVLRCRLVVVVLALLLTAGCTSVTARPVASRSPSSTTTSTFSERTTTTVTSSTHPRPAATTNSTAAAPTTSTTGRPAATTVPSVATTSTTAPLRTEDAKSATVIPGTKCPAFPPDNVWNTPITGLPVDPDSATWLASMDASTTDLHPDYGPSGDASKPYGIPWQIVSPSQKLVHVSFTYAPQSDPGPYPLSAATPIENGSDRHAIMVNPSTCVLYELWDTYYLPDGKSTAGSGAIWSLKSNALRPAGWTSADAAGLPILPGLVTTTKSSRDPWITQSGSLRNVLNSRTSGRPGTRPVKRTTTAHQWAHVSASHHPSPFRPRNARHSARPSSRQ